MPVTACSFSSVALIVWFQGIYCNPPPCCRHRNQPGSEAPVPAAALPASATSTSRGAARRPSSTPAPAGAVALRRWRRLAPALAGMSRALACVAVVHVPRSRRRRRCGTPCGHVFAGAQNSTAEKLSKASYQILATWKIHRYLCNGGSRLIEYSCKF